eukprot:scaffold4182_cov384-Prasinococcus_capsulatus_cf.AAC.11
MGWQNPPQPLAPSHFRPHLQTTERSIHARQQQPDAATLACRPRIGEDRVRGSLSASAYRPALRESELR